MTKSPRDIAELFSILLCDKSSSFRGGFQNIKASQRLYKLLSESLLDDKFKYFNFHLPGSFSNHETNFPIASLPILFLDKSNSVKKSYRFERIASDPFDPRLFDWR